MSVHPIEVLEEKVGEERLVVENLHVERGKVEEFARAIGEDNPAFRDVEAAAEQGFEEVPAPMTFTRIHMFPRYQPDTGGDGFDLGFDEAYIVHGEQEYEFQRPLYVGETLTGTATLTDVYQREGSRGGTMTFAEIETAFRNEDDELVVLERKTIIETGGAIEGGDEDD